MDSLLLNDIYLSLQGLLRPEYAVPGVSDLFTTDSECHRQYAAMRQAYERVCRRLGIDPDDEDDDLNDIVEAMEKIQEMLCKEMFRLGPEYAQAK